MRSSGSIHQTASGERVGETRNLAQDGAETVGWEDAEQYLAAEGDQIVGADPGGLADPLTADVGAVGRAQVGDAHPAVGRHLKAGVLSGHPRGHDLHVRLGSAPHDRSARPERNTAPGLQPADHAQHGHRTARPGGVPAAPAHLRSLNEPRLVQHRLRRRRPPVDAQPAGGQAEGAREIGQSGIGAADAHFQLTLGCAIGVDDSHRAAPPCRPAPRAADVSSVAYGGAGGIDLARKVVDRQRGTTRRGEGSGLRPQRPSRACAHQAGLVDVLWLGWCRSFGPHNCPSGRPATTGPEGQSAPRAASADNARAVDETPGIMVIAGVSVASAAWLEP